MSWDAAVSTGDAGSSDLLVEGGPMMIWILSFPLTSNWVGGKGEGSSDKDNLANSAMSSQKEELDNTN